MTTLNALYFTLPPLDQYFVDKDTGLPLAQGTLTFYRDANRTEAKTIFELNGTFPSYSYTPLNNPLTLSDVGTIVNASNASTIVYLYPYREDADGNLNLDLYYIECRNAAGTIQWTREAVPNLTEANDPIDDNFALSNQLANTQFSRVFINEDRSNSIVASGAVAEVYPVAPDWDLVVTGTGTIAVERVAIPGVSALPTSPPYVLDITVPSGITTCLLRQRMSANSGLWSSTADRPVFLSGSLIGENQNVGDVALTMFYQESSGAPASPIQIVTGNVSNGTYSLLQGSTADAIPVSTNTDTGEGGYIDIYVQLPLSARVRISSLQVIPTYGPSSEVVEYDPRSSNREQALMGDYFLPALEKKTAKSLLVGWDFPLNPRSFGVTSGSVLATAQYTWDQTIMQNTANMNYGANATTGGFEVTTSANNSAYALIQYLPQEFAKKVIGSKLSVNVTAHKTASGDPVDMRVYLATGTAAATFPTLPTTIGTVAANGVFTFTGGMGWTEIPRSGLPTATAAISTVATGPALNNDNDYGFNQWEMTDASQINDTDKLAIVVTFSCPSSATVVTVDSVSLTLGDIPCRPAPQSKEEVIQECQYFYEKSKELAFPMTAVSSAGALLRQMVANRDATSEGYKNSFHIQYQSPKLRLDPTVTIYDVNGNVDQVDVVLIANGAVVGSGVVAISEWIASNSGSKGINYLVGPPNVAIVAGGPGGNLTRVCHILFHYEADARLGLI